MWAYTNLPNEEIHTEATWLTVFFSLSLVANAMATCTLRPIPLSAAQLY